MKVAGILQSSIVDGEGIRDVLFLQGCKHHCKGCHNHRTWDINGGMEYSVDELVDEFKLGYHDITISGGEPLLQFQDDLYHFMKRMHREYGKRFWLYTGYRYEEIPNFVLIMLSEFTDVLVDGRFELDKKDPELQFRGSSNQRLIDLPKSVKEEKVVLWEGC
jgi:anaerobic ribonucleoside-triphosphate reductase activating protein